MSTAAHCAAPGKCCAGASRWWCSPKERRKSGPRVKPLFDGPVWLSVMTGAPILPVGIGGSEYAMPKGALLPRFRKVRVIFGEPIPPPAPAAGRRTVNAAERAVATAELREILQRLFDEAQAWAGTPNPSHDA